MVWPAYAALGQRGLTARADQLVALASPCRLCPRACGADRAHGERGFCRAGLVPWVASFGPHFGEEPELVGSGGSGTVFFSGCNLGCIFCQNYEISHLGQGREIPPAELAGWMLRLQRLGCHNLNLVTPTHQAPQIVAALALAVERGFHLPVVWNCGGYESVAALELLAGIVDIYMPDFKYGSDQVAARLAGAPNYVAAAQAAVREMHRQVGDLQCERGVARRGLLVRHLVLPEGLAGSEEVLRFLAQEVSRATYVNLMAQYYPAGQARRDPQLSRRVAGQEFRAVVAAAQRLGLARAGPR
ncbi:MAG: radical SAM protein [Candidatus Bipolaricaulaceae bacterium]